jgi:tripartite-type tricarboxylate transporter receptor subunit TctC
MPRFAALVLAFALALLPSENGFAQSYPTGPIKLVVGQAPGGHSDIIGRTLGENLADILKQPVVIDNRGGVGGTIGADFVARAPSDGYTLFLGAVSNLAIAVALLGKARYDPVRDFVPIGGAAIVPYALAVRPSIPATTVPELVAYARAHPGRLTYGSSGMGSVSSLAMEWVKAAAGVDIVHIPYRGTALAVRALLSGEIDLVVTDLSLLTPHVKAGTLRLLAAAGARRASAVPGLPTFAEQGIPGFAIEAWYGIVAPAGTPPEIVAKLSNGLSRALQAPEVRQRFEEFGYEPMVDTPAQFGALIRTDVERYAALIKRVGIKADP